MDKTLEALIIKTLDYQEHSQLVYFYTKSGMQSALARGVKKMNNALRPYIQVGNYLQITLSLGKLPTIKTAEKIDHYPSIKTDLIKTTVLSSLLETVSLCVSKEDDHPKLFNFLIKCFNALKKTNDALELSLLFDLKMLYFLGYGLNFNQCHVCASKDDLYLDTFTGMVSCKMHFDNPHVALNQDTFMPLKYLLYADVTTYESLALPQEASLRLMKIIDQLFVDHLGLKRKSKTLLYTLL
ncbi:MAG: DNA repair protein RecO [Candidatus Izemoplasmataceae bacterium]